MNAIKARNKPYVIYNTIWSLISNTNEHTIKNVASCTTTETIWNATWITFHNEIHGEIRNVLREILE